MPPELEDDVEGALPVYRWELYRVLAEPIRLRLLALTGSEELTNGELAELLNESQPNVSRHVASLKQAQLVNVRRQGTRSLVRLSDDVGRDAVVADALASGFALCQIDGSLARIADVLKARDNVGRDFFAKARGAAAADDALTAAPAELGAYLSALAPLLPNRELAIDCGTGDGGLLDVLAPVFRRVIGVDRSGAQLSRAIERIKRRGYDNIDLFEGELTDPQLAGAVGPGADVVFGVRLLHHAPRPADVVKQLGALCRVGGNVVVLDYARHDDETMRDQADLWLGFEPDELARFCQEARLGPPHVSRVMAPLSGPDAHLPWQVMVAERRESREPREKPKKSQK